MSAVEWVAALGARRDRDLTHDEKWLFIANLMHRLIYRSRVARHVRFADAEAIAEAAAQRNQPAKITGLLLYTPSHFLQVLEGDLDAVRETMQRIARDPRHGDVQVLEESEVEVREFGAWAMAARFCAAQVESLDGQRAFELLRAEARG